MSVRTATGYRAWPLGVLGLLLLLLSIPATAQGQDGALQAGDTILLEVEGHPEMRQLLTLNDVGRVELPQIGEVYLLGLTVEEAETTLGRRMRIYDPALEDVRVHWTDLNPVTILVQGAVNAPGSYTFEEDPAVWDVVKAAGGFLETADLVGSRVLREESGEARVQPLDLSALVTGGHLPQYAFRDGDVLVLPGIDDGRTQVQPSRGVQVFGAVSDPATVAMTAPRPLLDVLMLAGSPIATAEWKKVWLVHHSAGRYESRLVDLTLFTEQGDPAGNPLVYPGDVLRMEYQRDGWLRRNGPLVLGSMTAVATLWLAYDRVTE